MSARKRRYRKADKRLGRHKFRRDEARVLRGDKARGSMYGPSWNGIAGMRAKDLP